MTEIEVYQSIMDLCIAHSSTVEHKEIHGFGVGYLDMLNTNNLEKSEFRQGLFYSEKWYQKGTNPNAVILDYPFVLMLPVQVNGEINSKGAQLERDQYTCAIFVLDLLFNDRNGNSNSVYAKRSLEQIQADTQVIGVQLLKEFNKKYNAAPPKKQLANGGRFTAEKLYEFSNKRFAGTSFQFSILANPSCEDGSFDYGKEYSEKKEKFCKC